MVKLSFSAVSHIGELRAMNDDRVYASGKFSGSQEMENVQLSFESRDKQFIFAVSEGMESDEESDYPEISAMDELTKFQKKVKGSIKDVENKVEDMSDCIGQLNNLLYSMTIGNSDKKERKPSFAGLIIDNGKAAAINLGGCRSYRLEPESLRPIVNDYKRTERLLKMGIITDEQAEFIANQQGTVKSDSLNQVKKSDSFKLRENDILLICSQGLLEAVNEETIHEILSSVGETDDIANRLVKKAVVNGAKNNVTAAVIKILNVYDENATAKNTSPKFAGHINKFVGVVGSKKVNSSKIISTALMLVVAAAVIFGLYSLIASFMAGDNAGDKTTLAGIETNESTGSSEASIESSAPEETQGTDVSAETTTNLTDGTFTEYTIKKGDSLFTISKKFYGDSQKYDLIMEANNITDANKISVGKTLKIPALN